MGDRIALEYTSDPYTELCPGATGTVTGWDERIGQLWIDWDNGSTLMMIVARPQHPAVGAAPGEALDRVRKLPPRE